MNFSIVSSVIEKVNAALKNRDIPIGISNKHVHLSKHDFDILFPNQVIEELSKLSQTGQFAAKQVVTLTGPKGDIEKVRVLGPFRSETQVEVSMTNARDLGIAAPIKKSGDLVESKGIVLSTDFGKVKIERGVIVAKRHIHMNHIDAKFMGISDDQEVSVLVGDNERQITMSGVVVRVSESSVLEMHLDTDEANAAGLTGNKNCGYIVL